jgi:hypothetical protein
MIRVSLFTAKPCLDESTIMRVTTSCNQPQEKKMAFCSSLEVHTYSIVSYVLKVTIKVHILTAGKFKCSTYTWPFGASLELWFKIVQGTLLFQIRDLSIRN